MADATDMSEIDATLPTLLLGFISFVCMTAHTCVLYRCLKRKNTTPGTKLAVVFYSTYRFLSMFLSLSLSFIIMVVSPDQVTFLASMGVMAMMQFLVLIFDQSIYSVRYERDKSLKYLYVHVAVEVIAFAVTMVNAMSPELYLYLLVNFVAAVGTETLLLTGPTRWLWINEAVMNAAYGMCMRLLYIVQLVGAMRQWMFVTSLAAYVSVIVVGLLSVLFIERMGFKLKGPSLVVK